MHIDKFKSMIKLLLNCSGVRPYKCEHCDKAFTQRCSLESHARKVHNIQFNYKHKERRDKVYVCEECGHSTGQSDQHFMHMKVKHPHVQISNEYNINHSKHATEIDDEYCSTPYHTHDFNQKRDINKNVESPKINLLPYFQ